MFTNAWKIMPGIFFKFFPWLWQNLGNWDFAKQSTTTKKIPWHDFPCICDILFDFLRTKKFWPKIWPNWTKFGQIFGSEFFVLPPQNGICQHGLIPKVWHFYLTWFKSYFTWCSQTSQGQFLFDLVAFKVINWSNGASIHIV